MFLSEGEEGAEWTRSSLRLLPLSSVLSEGNRKDTKTRVAGIIEKGADYFLPRVFLSNGEIGRGRREGGTRIIE